MKMGCFCICQSHSDWKVKVNITSITRKYKKDEKSLPVVPEHPRPGQSVRGRVRRVAQALGASREKGNQQNGTKVNIVLYIQ